MPRQSHVRSLLKGQGPDVSPIQQALSVSYSFRIYSIQYWKPEEPMIEIHDGYCRPFNLARIPGRSLTPDSWNISNGVRTVATQPLLGWRIVPFCYTDKGIQGAGGFRPSPRGQSPFGDGINCLPPARCRGQEMLRGKDSHLLRDSVLTERHQAPDPRCTCGYRIVHDVKDAVRFYHRHRDAFKDAFIVPDGMTKSVAVFAVRGGGLTCRSVEFPHFNDPVGTVRVQHVAMEAIVLLDSEDAHTGPLFEELGYTVHILPELAKAHEASRCGSEYEVKQAALTDNHALRLADRPGTDGGTYFTRSGEWGAYGAAGVLLKTQGPEPHYLLQQRAHEVSYGGKWSIPGGALHEFETPGEAAARELKEEMGIDRLEDLKVIEAVTLQSHDWKYHTIIAECSDRPRISENSEVAATAWLTRTQIEDLAAGGKCHPLFEAALSSIFTSPNC